VRAYLFSTGINNLSPAANAPPRRRIHGWGGRQAQLRPCDMSLRSKQRRRAQPTVLNSYVDHSVGLYRRQRGPVPHLPPVIIIQPSDYRPARTIAHRLGALTCPDQPLVVPPPPRQECLHLKGNLLECALTSQATGRLPKASYNRIRSRIDLVADGLVPSAYSALAFAARLAMAWC
jgi:hypothetical protein